MTFVNSNQNVIVNAHKDGFTTVEMFIAAHLACKLLNIFEDVLWRPFQ